MSVLTFLSTLLFLELPVASADAPHITGIEHVNDRWDKVSVFSPAMNKVVVNDVFKSPKSGSPTFYLLPGIDGGDNLDPGGNFAPGTKSWFGFTDLQGFFGNKNVNVVSPLGGQFSWYTNWVNDGSKQYQTYMTQELPPLINKTRSGRDCGRTKSPCASVRPTIMPARACSRRWRETLPCGCVETVNSRTPPAVCWEPAGE